MDNHIHFVAVPKKQDSMAKVFKAVQMTYCQYFNKKYDYVGHLWQGRYYSCPMDEKHSFIAVRYIENNPVRAGAVENPKDYRWSSAQAHIDGMSDVLLSGDCWLDKNIDNWSEYLAGQDSNEDIESFKNCTKKGIPFGRLSFHTLVEKATGRTFSNRKRGRPTLVI